MKLNGGSRVAKHAAQKSCKKITATKLVVYSFLLMFIIAFAVGTKVVLVDTSQLYGYLTFVGAPIAIIVPAYFMKSKAENSVGGITYETAMQEMSEDSVG